MTTLGTCGCDCGPCEEFDKTCAGCRPSLGKPPWLHEAGMETCVFYHCAVAQKGFDDCGDCLHLPCAKFTELRPPGLTDEELAAVNNTRIEALRSMKGN